MNAMGGSGRGSRARARICSRARLLAAAIGAVSAIMAVSAGPAGAAVSGGQIGEAWGKAGGTAGKFVSPGMLGVDTSDGSVYVGEELEDLTHFRLQKFTSGGEFKASVEIPRIVKEGEAEYAHGLHGIAIDPVLHRVYLLESCRLKVPATTCQAAVGELGASKILAYSTEEEGSTLKPALAEPLPVPGGEEAIYEPQTIAVDPSSHDLVILGENSEQHIVIQRISSTGVPGARFVDTGNELRPSGRFANSLAVGPDGRTYLLTGGPSKAGAQFTRAWQMPPSLSHVEPVPGFAEAAESEGWATGLLAPKSAAFLGGPQIAVSPDGGTLYWKESIEQPTGETAEPGNVLVRGFSLAKRETTALYGNGLDSGKKTCLIQTPEAGLATVGDEVVVFDYGPGEESTSFGNRVMNFGPGGGGCRSPVARFTANGKSEGEEVTIAKGESVTFDSTPSEILSGQSVTELDWDFGDGGDEKKTGSPPAKSISHTFTSAGTYRVTLRMKLDQPEKANYGNPLPVTRLVKVTGGSLAKLTISKAGSGWGTVTSSPAGIACGADCDQEFEAGKEVTLTASAAAGSEFAGWTGCGSEAGGKCMVTMSGAKAVEATFEPLSEFKLKVNKSGSGKGAVTSSPSGIDCRKDCEQEFEANKSVTLKAKAASGSKFSGWSGAGCSGTGSCAVTIDEAKEVTAIFNSLGEDFSLRVEKTGNGEGLVSSIQKGLAEEQINCGVHCEESFTSGREVELLQESQSGSSFIKWGGCDAVVTGKCLVTLTENRTVTAEYESTAPPKLKITRIGSGATSGIVESSPEGIICPSTCELGFTKGELVTLTHGIAEGAEAEFVKWGGACSGSGACEVTMSGEKTVTAEFKSTAKPKFPLELKMAGTGSGRVTSSPTGIDCGNTCKFEFAEGTTVTLTVAADPGSEFVKWTGGGCGGSGACEVTMTGLKAVTATFKALPKKEGQKEEPKPSAPTPTPTPTPTLKKPLTPVQKALQKCKRLKGKKRAKCIKQAKSIGKKKHKQRSRQRPLEGRD